MAIPGSIKRVEVTGQWWYSDGRPVAGGRLLLTPTGYFTVDGEGVVPTRQYIVLDENGSIPAGTTLFATNDPSASQPWVYTVKERWQNGRTHNIVVDYVLNTVNIPDLAPAVPPTEMERLEAVVQGVVDNLNLVAEAPLDGKLRGRIDGGWAEIPGGSYQASVDVTVGAGGDFETFSELIAWANMNAGKALYIEVSGYVRGVVDQDLVISFPNWQTWQIYSQMSAAAEPLPIGYFRGYTSDAEINGRFSISSAVSFEGLRSIYAILTEESQNVGHLNLTAIGNPYVRTDFSIHMDNCNNANVSGTVVSLQSSSAYYVELINDSSFIELLGHNSIGALDCKQHNIDTLFHVSSTATTVSSLGGDSNVTRLITTGKTINTFNNWGFVTVANK